MIVRCAPLGAGALVRRRPSATALGAARPVRRRDLGAGAAQVGALRPARRRRHPRHVAPSSAPPRTPRPASRRGSGVRSARSSSGSQDEAGRRRQVVRGQAASTSSSSAGASTSGRSSSIPARSRSSRSTARAASCSRASSARPRARRCSSCPPAGSTRRRAARVRAARARRGDRAPRRRLARLRRDLSDARVLRERITSSSPRGWRKASGSSTADEEIEVVAASRPSSSARLDELEDAKTLVGLLLFLREAR